MAHEEHEDGVASRGINWPKWHDVKGVEGAIGAGKTEFLTVGPADADLVEAGLGINADPVELAGTRGKVVNCNTKLVQCDIIISLVCIRIRLRGLCDENSAMRTLSLVP